MATTTQTACPTCHGSGFCIERQYTFDGFATQNFDQDFCACEYGQFCQWLFGIADDLEQAEIAVRDNDGHFESQEINSTEAYWDKVLADGYYSALNAERAL